MKIELKNYLFHCIDVEGFHFYKSHIVHNKYRSHKEELMNLVSIYHNTLEVFELDEQGNIANVVYLNDVWTI